MKKHEKVTTSVTASRFQAPTPRRAEMPESRNVQFFHFGWDPGFSLLRRHQAGIKATSDLQHFSGVEFTSIRDIVLPSLAALLVWARQHVFKSQKFTLDNRRCKKHHSIQQFISPL